MADGQVAAAAMDGEQETGAPAQQTSLRYLRLQNEFRNMLKSGLDRLDEQTFLERFQGYAAPHHLRHLWSLVRMQCDKILQVACAEAEAACDEVGLQQQLQELESLILQRGLMGTDSSSADATTALPSAAESAARVAAMQAEKQQLQQQLQEMLQQQAAVEAELQARQAAADDVLQEFDRDIADPVEQVYKAAVKWVQPMHDGVLQEPDAMQP